jgi:hypothetical protein
MHDETQCGTSELISDAATTTTLSPLALRHRNRLLGPRTELFRIIQELGRHLVILHDLAIGTIWSKRPHASTLKVRSIRVVHLEIENILGDKSKEDGTGVDADATEHASCADVRDRATQLIYDECSKTRADWHT